MVINAAASQDKVPALSAILAVAAVGAAGLIEGDDLVQVEARSLDAGAGEFDSPGVRVCYSLQNS
jgi:hypothetical protein